MTRHTLTGDLRVANDQDDSWPLNTVGVTGTSPAPCSQKSPYNFRLPQNLTANSRLSTRRRTDDNSQQIRVLY